MGLTGHGGWSTPTSEIFFRSWPEGLVSTESTHLGLVKRTFVHLIPEASEENA